MSDVELRSKTELTSIVGTENIYVQEAGSPYTVKRLLLDTIKTWIAGTPVGTVIESASISAPYGYLACDGTAISRSTYSSLYNAMTVSKGTCTISIATPGVVTLSTHGLATGSNIELTTTGALPTGLTANTNYFVIYNDANSFWLATSFANALAGTKIATSGTQSGTHSLRFTPYGIDTSANFKVPNRIAVVGKGVGNQTINTRVKTGPVNLGSIIEDTGQGWQLGASADATGARDYFATTGSRDQYYNTTAGAANNTISQLATSLQGDVKMLKAMNDGTNGTPRTGAQTQDCTIGMNYFIKY